MASNYDPYRHLGGLSLAQRFENHSHEGLLPTPSEFIRDFGIRNNNILARVFSTDLFKRWEVRGALSHFCGPILDFKSEKRIPTFLC